MAILKNVSFRKFRCYIWFLRNLYIDFIQFISVLFNHLEFTLNYYILVCVVERFFTDFARWRDNGKNIKNVLQFPTNDLRSFKCSFSKLFSKGTTYCIYILDLGKILSLYSYVRLSVDRTLDMAPDQLVKRNFEVFLLCKVYLVMNKVKSVHKQNCYRPKLILQGVRFVKHLSHKYAM